jgi:hypothetical protein
MALLIFLIHEFENGNKILFKNGNNDVSFLGEIYKITPVIISGYSFINLYNPT